MRTFQYLVVIVMACTVMLPARADYEQTVTPGTSGNYFGLEMGGTNIHSTDKYLPNQAGVQTLTRPSNNGFGFRLYWGYQFTQYLDVEAGYAFYSPSIYKIPQGNQPELRIQTLDILGKGTLPIFWGINVFAEGGVALVFYKQGGLLSPNTQGGTDGSSGVTVRPKVGAGLSYRFSPNWSVSATLSRVTKGGVVPNSDMYTIGLSYHAVDLYCGQFLC